MIYLFPGLGASEKLFEPYVFDPLKATTIPFLVPEKGETLSHYCERMAAGIKRDEENIYIGVSFGGIIAQEISKKLPPRKIILISSIKTIYERPWYFNLLRWFPLHQVIPSSVSKKVLQFLSESLTKKTTDERERFRILLKEADDRVISWGITQTANWDNGTVLPNIFHIHGDRDIVFPIRNIKADYVIHHGAHFTVMREIKEINEKIMSLLQTESVEVK